MTWLLSPSGWPVFADTGDEQADLAGRGYEEITEAEVPAAIAAFQAAESSPPSTQLPGWALAADVAAALATKANASSLPGKLSISDIPNPDTAGGAALRAALVSTVGTRAAPVTDPATARPDTPGAVYWLCANGVAPVNAADGDLIWNADA